MPHLAFYALDSDVEAIASFVLGAADCRALESYSQPDAAVREFATPLEVLEAWQSADGWLGLMLYAPRMRGALHIERLDLRPNAIRGKSWRERVLGWGLIQLQFAGTRDDRLHASRTNHNTHRRALAWSSTSPTIAPPSAWDFDEIAKTSRRLNHHIRETLGVRRVASRPILPAASRWLETTHGELDGDMDT